MLIYFLPSTNSGPRPFKFFNYWLECDGFKEALAEGWSISVSRRPLFILVKKLQNAKTSLKSQDKGIIYYG